MGFIYKRRHFRKGRKTLQGRTIWICYSRNGKRIRESSGSTKESDARKLLRLREGAVAQGQCITPRSVTIRVNELLEDVIVDWQVNKRRTVRDLKRRITKYLLPFFGGVRASAISTADVRRYILLRQQAGASNATINREIAALRRAFLLAIESGKMFNRPHIRLLRENNVRTGFFEREQFERVRNHLDCDLQPLVTFAYITGWRKSEILSLQWPLVDFRAGFIRLNPGTTKNDEGRVFPLTKELRSVLEAQKARTDSLKKLGIICPWIFHRKGKQIKSFRGSWDTACKKAGLPGKIPHDFRRTAVRNLVRAGVPERVAMQMTGHKTRAVFERYNIVSEGDFRDAAFKLNQFAQGR